MNFEYHWKNNEANFGPPIQNQVAGGAHITFEILPRYQGRIIALRRPMGIPHHELPPAAKKYPEGLLYFCHNLIRYGESIESFIQRTVTEQTGVVTDEYKILTIESEVQEKDGQWAFTPYAVAELSTLPTLSKEVTEIIQFDKNTIPDGFAWWAKAEIQEFLEVYNL